MLQKIKNICHNRSAYIKAYLWPLPRFRREIVVMVDGVHTHGGLGDRLKFILSVYSYCKENSIPFKIYWIYPFKLERILLPNHYDWRIKESELSFSHYDTKEICLWYKKRDAQGKNYSEQNISLLDKEIGKERKQFHLYGNIDSSTQDYDELFHELFKPSQYLSERIDLCKQQLTKPYEAVTLRFQQLLGDFEEGDFPILPDSEKEDLIRVCKNMIIELYYTGYFSTEKILVTSDSPSFLEEIDKLNYVYTIPGRMEHMDFTHNSDLEVYAKSFVDLIMLSKAQRITLLKTGQMYRSGFPKFAAEMGSTLFNEIVFKI